jgi:uncharacterized damage-inducible protein DinB
MTATELGLKRESRFLTVMACRLRIVDDGPSISGRRPDDAATPASSRTASPRALRQPEAPGKWSILEVVGHLADTEVVYRYRMRMSVAQPGSAIPDYDQDRWAKQLRYNEAGLEDGLREIEALRSANLAWLERLSDEEMDRAGLHEERGEESVRRIVKLLAAHDLVHRNQIRRIKSAL